MKRNLWTVSLAVCLLLLASDASLNKSAATGRENDDFIIYMPVIAQHAAPIHITEALLLRARSAHYYVSGNLQNPGPNPVYGAVIQAVVYDKLGQWRHTYTTTARFPATFLGHFNRFTIWTTLNDNDYDVGNARVDAQVVSWTMSSDDSHHPLTLVSSQIEYDYDRAEVDIQAVFRNDTPYPLTSLLFDIWELKYYLYGTSTPPSYLAPGDSFTATGGMTSVDPHRVGLIKIEGMGQANP